MANRRTNRAAPAAPAAPAAEIAAQAPWPFPKSEDIAAQQSAHIDAFFASRLIIKPEDAESSDEISDADIAAQQKAGEEAFDAAIEAAMANADEAAPAKGAKKPYIHRSSILKPTKKAWAIYDAMRQFALENALAIPTRGECIAEAIKQGVASGTSATQYQYWKKHYGY